MARAPRRLQRYFRPGEEVSTVPIQPFVPVCPRLRADAPGARLHIQVSLIHPGVYASPQAFPASS